VHGTRVTSANRCFCLVAFAFRLSLPRVAALLLNAGSPRCPATQPAAAHWRRQNLPLFCPAAQLNEQRTSIYQNNSFAVWARPLLTAVRFGSRPRRRVVRRPTPRKRRPRALTYSTHAVATISVITRRTSFGGRVTRPALGAGRCSRATPPPLCTTPVARRLAWQPRFQRLLYAATYFYPAGLTKHCRRASPPYHLTRCDDAALAHFAPPRLPYAKRVVCTAAPPVPSRVYLAGPRIRHSLMDLALAALTWDAWYCCVYNAGCTYASRVACCGLRFVTMTPLARTRRTIVGCHASVSTTCCDLSATHRAGATLFDASAAA